MKIALICPSNLQFMPYVNNYIAELKIHGVSYEIISWDRFNLETECLEMRYRDKKNGHKRNYFDYLGYKKFLLSLLSAKQYDKIIIFGIQLGYFLKDYLYNKYEGELVFDIRDYNKIVKFYNIGKLIQRSEFTVLSSPGFKKWLPDSNKFIVNHNTTMKNLTEKSSMIINSEDKLKITYIGAIRDYKIQRRLLRSLVNSELIELHYHGEGRINNKLTSYIVRKKITNAFLTGRYQVQEETNLYANSDMVNVILPLDDINSRTLLPNRLYHSALNCKPIVTLDGTFLATVVKKYNLGLVISSFDNLENTITQYINVFNTDKYLDNRNKFLKSVLEDNIHFEEKLTVFAR